MWISKDPLIDFFVSPKILRSLSRLDEFKGRWNALQNSNPEHLDALKRTAMLRSVAASIAATSSRSTEVELEDLLAGLSFRSLRTFDEQIAAGYAVALRSVQESYAHTPLTERTIADLHLDLLRFSTIDTRHRGHYKTLPNVLESRHLRDQTHGSVLRASSPADTPREMDQLVAWASTSLDNDTYHPLLVIGMFVVRFLAIHPFQDGNARLAHLLTTLLLLRAGYRHVIYVSREHIVEQNRYRYEDALRRAQLPDDPERDIHLHEWIVAFLDTLTQQMERLVQELAQSRSLDALPRLSELLLGAAKTYGRLTVSTGVRLTEANRNTVKVHLRKLVTSGHLSRHGQGKGSWYTIGNTQTAATELAGELSGHLAKPSMRSHRPKTVSV
jgi:Fic family protein